MNREIKFRAWDDHNKEMINPYCKLEENNHFWGEDMTNTHYVSPVAVMQFTGLLDKNGKEIYEADILEHPKLEHDSVQGTVEFHNGCFGLKTTMFEQFFPIDEDGYQWDELIIIGNIHEHPELLTK